MANRRPYSLIRAIIRLLLLTLWCIFAPLVYFLVRLFSHYHAERIPMIFHRVCARILGLHIVIQGRCTEHRPTLFVSNHVSYLDVFILGSNMPGCFIAKSEVAHWPILGQLARIQNTLFFERKGSRAHSQISIMSNHLSRNGNLILFPEGTSTEGTYVEPFKSSLFHAAEVSENTLIQPVTLGYTKYRNKPMDKEIRDYFAWYATMPFASHFFKMAGMHSVEIELIFLPPVKIEDFSCRKACAEYCHAQVTKALAEKLQPALSEGVHP